MLWKIPVTWEMYGCVWIEAETLEEAMDIAEDPDDQIPLPDDGAYVDGSWALSCTEPEVVRLFQTPQKGQQENNMTYNITMERTLSLSVDFEAENDDEALAKADQIYYGAKPEEFEDGSEAFDYALCDPQTGRTLIDWD